MHNTNPTSPTPPSPTPQGRQAAIFQSRNSRIETVQEAMQRFADELTGPGVAENIASMIAEAGPGESPALTISITIHRDNKTPGAFAAKMQTERVTQLGDRKFYGLRCAQ